MRREIPRTGRVILYCACPPSNVQAAYEFLRDQGYRNTSVMEEGFPGWVKLGYPVKHRWVATLATTGPLG